MILSAGMGFDNIVGLPEVTRETVREVGGSWYGSLTCANGEEPDTAARTRPLHRVLFQRSSRA